MLGGLLFLFAKNLSIAKDVFITAFLDEVIGDGLYQRDRNREAIARVEAGVAVLGICNGFQILTESHLLPGALLRNADLKFVSRPVELVVDESQSAFTRKYSKGERVRFPVAHGEGNYFADEETLNRLEGEDRVVFRYAPGDNPNGSARNIAGILNEKRNVLGMMPHPERACDPLLGSTTGRPLFQSLIDTLS